MGLIADLGEGLVDLARGIARGVKKATARKYPNVEETFARMERDRAAERARLDAMDTGPIPGEPTPLERPKVRP